LYIPANILPSYISDNNLTVKIDIRIFDMLFKILKSEDGPGRTRIMTDGAIPFVSVSLPCIHIGVVLKDGRPKTELRGIPPTLPTPLP